MNSRVQMGAENASKILELIVRALPAGAHVHQYFTHDDPEHWTAKGEVAGEKSRSIVIDQPVIDLDSTNWEALLRDLDGMVREDFPDPQGSVVRVHRGRGARDPNGYYIRRDR